jgi:hypothetical protein
MRELGQKMLNDEDLPPGVDESEPIAPLNGSMYWIMGTITCIVAVCVGVIFALLTSREDTFRDKIKDFCLASSILAEDDLFFKFGRSKMSFSPITIVDVTGHSISDRSQHCVVATDSDVYITRFTNNLSDVYTTQFTNNLSAILDVQPTDGRRKILLEGDVGAGKSTLVRKLCHDYTTGEFGKEYEIVLKIELGRGPISSLKDLVATTIGREDLIEDIVSFINKHNGKGVLFLFDAFDEYPAEYCKKSVVMDIFRGRVAPKSSYLVTSRPSAAPSLLPYVDQHDFLCGYTKTQVHGYIHSYFHNSDVTHRGNELIQTLSNNVRLSRMCSSPLILLIICHIANTADKELMTHLAEGDVTFTEIFNKSLLAVANRYADKDEKQQPSFLYPDDYISHSSFKQLTKLALFGIVNGMRFFSTADRKLAEKLNLGCDLTDLKHMGLLNNITASGEVGGTVVVYHFVHYSFQELFAAYELAALSPAAQLHFWKAHLVMDHDKLRLYSVVEKGYEMVFLFFAGLTQLTTSSIQQLLLVQKYVQPNMGLRISLDNPLIEMCTVLHESQNIALVQSILSDFGSELETEKSMYYYKRHHRTTSWCLAYHPSLTGLKFSEWTVSEVSGFLRDFDTDHTFSNVISLDWYISGGNINATELNSICQFFQSHPLDSVKLNTQELTESDADEFLFQFITSSKTSIASVDIHGSHNTRLDPLVPLLKKCPVLRSVTLRSVSVSLQQLKDMLSISSITKLDICGIEVKSDLPQNETVLDITTAIGKLKSLSDVICINTFEHTGEFERSLLMSLGDLPKLQNIRLSIPDFLGDKVLSSVARSLQNGTITALSLSGLHLSSDPLYEQFFSSLQHSPLSELSLQFSVTEDTESGNESIFRAFHNGLQNCPSLKSLTLGGDWPTQVTTHVLSSLSLCSHLDQLKLTRCSLDYNLIKTLGLFVGSTNIRSVKLIFVGGLNAKGLATFLVESIANPVLEEVSISCNGMHIEDGQDTTSKEDVVLNKLQEAVGQSSTLKSINIRCSHFPWTEVAAAILEGTTGSSSIKVVDFIVHPLPGNAEEVKALVKGSTVVMVADRGERMHHTSINN